MRALAAAIAILAALLLPAAAQAQFGLSEFDATFTDAEGFTVHQAGAHPFQANVDLHFISSPTGFGGEEAEQKPKDILVNEPDGLTGSPDAVPQCSAAQFLDLQKNISNLNEPACPDNTAIGVVAVRLSSKLGAGPLYAPVYNLAPPPGKAAKFGFMIGIVRIPVELGISEAAPHVVFGGPTDLTQIIEVLGSKLVLWGVPADPAHDPLRGRCLDTGKGGFETKFLSAGDCSAGEPPRAFLTMPRACEGPLPNSYATDSWQNPGARLQSGAADLADPAWVSGSALTHDGAGVPQGMSGCERLAFSPVMDSKLTSASASSGSGLDFSLDFNDEGLSNPEGIAGSDVKRAEIDLPEGVTINPSVGEGLGVCTPAQLARETAFSQFGEGCPQSSKIGTLHVETPLVSEAIDGQIYLAQQDDPATTAHGAENPFDSLIAFYFVLKNPNLGVSVIEPVKVEPDLRTGRLVATLDDNAQIPFSHLEAHLRTGARAALVTPPACGTYETQARFYPWADPTVPTIARSSFQITSGVGGGPCPPGGVPPFSPGFQAGSQNNAAGRFSPFDMRVTRKDGEQDMTKFSATLPPGELGSLAGVEKCPDSAIAAAKAKTGRQELASPSCPPNSLIGHTLAGAGVGDALTYVKGYVYLGGPYHGDPLSVIAITPALAGPYDAGTVVVQEALTLNPKTAEVEVDGAASDPIPHILKGIVLKLRDLRVEVDRPGFTLNPTSCAEERARSVLYGSYLDVLSPADDRPVDLGARFQASSCASLAFKPRLGLKLIGGVRRGGHPGLKAVYTPQKGDANIKGLVVRLPRSAFLDQAHIKTICTRVQFAAGAGNGAECPKRSRYGYVRAWTPLLDEPLQGPVFLRSSNHKLPDLVLALHGLVDIEVDIRIDSAHGGIRATLEEAPDAPLSRVLLRMQGAKKGLIINSRSLCAHTSRANVLGTGHNGKRYHTHPVMRAQCGKARHKKRHRRHRKRARTAR